jgi:hypothetical protein
MEDLIFPKDLRRGLRLNDREKDLASTILRF